MPGGQCGRRYPSDGAAAGTAAQSGTRPNNHGTVDRGTAVQTRLAMPASVRTLHSGGDGEWPTASARGVHYFAPMGEVVAATRALG